MLIAVDTNVLMDLAAQIEPVIDAVELVRRRITDARLVVLPTVIQELRYIAKFGETDEDVGLATAALEKLTEWRFEAVSFVPVEYGIIEQISLKLRHAGLLPEAEVNDSFILSEAALLGCGLFLTSDAHFAELDFQALTFELRSCDVSVPAIASPREVLSKFYR